MVELVKWHRDICFTCVSCIREARGNTEHAEYSQERKKKYPNQSSSDENFQHVN